MTARNSAEQRETIPPIVSPVKENYLKIERETVFLYFLFPAVGKGDQTHVAGKINVKTHWKISSIAKYSAQWYLPKLKIDRL